MRTRFIFTIGHSTHTQKEFLEILKSYDIEQLVDIRSLPGSRHCPQFNQEEMKIYLKKNQIKYIQLKSLGGRKKGDKNSSLNLAWRSPSFRYYADYMQTKEFSEGLKTLMKISLEKVTAIMCAEAVPWRCHRSLVSDALIVRGWDVFDIFNLTNVSPHFITPFAKVDGRRITYPSSEEVDNGIDGTYNRTYN